MNQPRAEHWSYDPYAETVHELLGAAPVLLNWLISAVLLNFEQNEGTASLTMQITENKITSVFKRDHSNILHKNILEQIQQNSSLMPPSWY